MDAPFEDTRPEAPAIPAEQALELRFTGSGSEYFRIWIVNLLLSVVTLSLYRPWAKVRRLRYFYANTFVAGHPLDFHGDPKRMLRGYLLVGAMVAVYSVAGRFSPVAALVAFLLLCAIWPALLRSALRFRLANTSWRGLRFGFSGDTGGAYRALLPLFLPTFVLVLLHLGVDDPKAPPAWYLKGVLATMAVSVLFIPWALWNLKRWQHGHYRLGQWQTRLTAGAGSFYGLTLKVVGVGLLSMVGVVLVAALVGGLVIGFKMVMGGGSPGRLAAMAFGILIAVATYLLMLLFPVPYAISRAQNLVWSNTRSEAVRFESALRYGPLLGLTFKNWALMLLTLGLYWPFAAVATYRLRVEAIRPVVAGELDALHQQAQERAADASGDFAGDFFGIDIGF